MATLTLAEADTYRVVLPFTLAEEGGWSADPHDPGNANPHAVPGGGGTLNGITQGSYDAWRRAQGAPLRPVREMTPEERAAIYEANYWRASGAGALAAAGKPKLAMVAFDWGVNGGVAKARWYVQAAVGTAPDGVWGPKTLAAIAAANDAVAAAELLELRACFHRVRGLGDRVARGVLVAAGLPALRRGISPTYAVTARPYMGTWLGRCRRLATLCALPHSSVYALGMDRTPLALDAAHQGDAKGDAPVAAVRSPG